MMLVLDLKKKDGALYVVSALIMGIPEFLLFYWSTKLKAWIWGGYGGMGWWGGAVFIGVIIGRNTMKVMCPGLHLRVSFVSLGPEGGWG